MAWVEAQALKNETGRTIGQWLFEEVRCRFGCIRKIIIDNAMQYKAAVNWIEKKYGITRIQVSAYNSQANGKCDGDLSKWYWFLPFALWADRITTLCSDRSAPHHPAGPSGGNMVDRVTGPGVNNGEHIGYRARALVKHQQHVQEMRNRIDKEYPLYY